MNKDLAYHLDKFQVSTQVVPILASFYILLQEKNQQLNLTRIADEDAFVEKHVIDSLAVLACKEPGQNCSLLDLGTGGGFPGIPLWIARPYWEITLLDATRKKIVAVEQISQALKLQFPEWLERLPVCVHGRAEDLGQENHYREEFDIVVSRAVALLPILLELCLPFVRLGGIFVAMKGPHYHIEAKDIESVSNKLGAHFVSEISYTLPTSHQRVCLIFEKISHTPSQYPRRAGIPARKPLN